MFDRIFKSTLRTGIPFGIFMTLLFSWRHGWLLGFIGGAGSGILFGLLMGLFVEAQRKKLKSKTGLFEGESIVFEGPANHFLKAEGRGGWLTLTRRILAFDPTERICRISL